jgi:hypothetical protein
MQTDDLKVGALVVVRGLGLGKIKSVKDGVCTVRLTADDDTAEIRGEKVPALLRWPMSAAEAGDVHEILARKAGPPDGRSWGEQYIELQRVLKTGTPKEQALHLQRLYRLSNPGSAQQRVLDSYEDALLPELAHSLKKKLGGLRSQLHRNQPAFGYMAPERDDDAPVSPPTSAPNGWHDRGAFRVFSGRMAIGEFPVSEGDATDYGDFRANLVPACRNGDWFSFSREYEGDDSDGDEYVIVHRDGVGEADALLKTVRLLGAVAVEGGAVHFLDEEVRDDKRYQRELETGKEPLGRGFIAELGGDGATEIFGGTGSGGGDFVLFYVKS